MIPEPIRSARRAAILHRTVLTQHTRRLPRTRTQRDRDRVTDPTRQRQQLQGRLTDRTIHMIDQNQNISHALQTDERREKGGKHTPRGNGGA